MRNDYRPRIASYTGHRIRSRNHIHGVLKNMVIVEISFGIGGEYLVFAVGHP